MKNISNKNRFYTGNYTRYLILFLITFIVSPKAFSQCPPTPYGSTINSHCGPGQFTLTAATQGNYTGVSHKWYTTSSGSTQVPGVYVQTNQTGIYVTALTQTFSSNVTYWVSANKSGCSESARVPVTVTIDYSDIPSISVPSNPLTACNDGSFVMIASPGSSYDWRFNTVNTIGSITKSTSQNYVPTETGYYWVIVNGPCGSMATSSVHVVLQNPLTPQVSITKTPSGSTFCPGTQITLTANPQNTQAAPSYQWKIGPTVVSTASQYVFSLGQTTTIDLIMTSNDNCITASTATSSITINQYPYPTQGELQGIGAYCEPATGSSMAVYNSQSGFNYYLYRGGSEVAMIPGNGGVAQFPLQSIAGTYTLQAANTSCPSNRIAMPGGPINVSAVSHTTVSIYTGGVNPTSVCESSGITLTAQASRTIQQVIWRNVDTGAVMETDVAPNSFQFIPPTTIGTVNYRAEMLVNSGCGNNISKDAIVSVTHVASKNVSVSINGGGGTYCPYEIVQLTASPQNSTSHSFVWKQGSTTISTHNYVDVTVNQNKTITLTMTSNDYCVNQPSQQSTTLTMNPIPTGQLVGSHQICLDNPTSGVVLMVTNATQNYNYYLVRDNVTVESNLNVDVSQSSGIFTFPAQTIPGNYMLMAAVPNCSPVTLTTNHIITQDSLTTVSISASGPTTNLCLSSDIELEVTATRQISGIQWMIDGVEVPHYLNSTTFDPTEIGSEAYGTHDYSASLTVANGCGYQVEKVTTIVPIELNGESIASPTTIGDDGCLTDLMQMSVQDYSYTVRWFETQEDANTNINHFHEGPTLDSLFQNGGVYTFYIIDQNSSCSSLPVSVEANVISPLPPSSKVDGKAFEGNPMTLSVSGGGPNYNWYDASTGGNLVTTGSTFGITPNQNLTYYVYSEDQGCISTDYITVDALLYPLPEISSSSGNVYLPIGSSVDLSVGNYDTYDWKYRGQTVGTSSVYSASNIGIYSLSVTIGTESASTDFTLYSAWEDQDQQINYIVSSMIKKPVSDAFEIGGLSILDRNIQINYFDGLGRDLQNVTVQASPSFADLVQPVQYDNYGRQQKQFLPYASNYSSGKFDIYSVSGSNKQANFYNNPPQFVTSDAYPYSQIIYDDSPLNRVLEQGAPGADWQPIAGNPGAGNTILYTYDHNTSSDPVKQWNIVNDLPTYSANYSAGELYKTTTRDEEKHSVQEFKTKTGQTILKRVQVDEAGTSWADTYYIYDDFDNLAFVLPPEASARYDTEYASDSQTFLAKWAFQYQYDNLNRMVTKQVPGADPVYMVYDARDRLVLTQDGNQRDPSATTGMEWSFTKYDHLNRPILTGVYEHSSQIDQSAMQVLVDAHYNGVADKFWHEAYGISEPIFGYTNRSFPIVSDKSDYLSVTYYDNYVFLDYLIEFGNNYYYSQPSGTCINKSGVDYCFEPQASSLTKGQITGTKIRNLNNPQLWINSATYYDSKYRPIQTITNNQKGGFDRSSNLYDFVGSLLANQLSHSTSEGADIVIKTRFEYDHMDRLMRGYHEIIDQGLSQGEVLLAENKYNTLGELIEKNLHVENNIPLQSVDYRYNIRGWLQSINNSTLTNTANNEDDPANLKDMFGMELIYNNPITGIPGGQ